MAYFLKYSTFFKLQNPQISRNLKKKLQMSKVEETVGWWRASLLGFLALGLDISGAYWCVGVGDGFLLLFYLGLFGLGLPCLLTGASL